MVPYRDNGHLTRAQRKFNAMLSSCRIVAEHAFGKAKQRFRYLYHSRGVSLVRTVKLVYACCILHNLVNTDDSEIFTDGDVGPDTTWDTNNVEDLMLEGFEFVNDEPGNDLRNELCRQLCAAA